jgi:hypothetical protein
MMLGANRTQIVERIVRQALGPDRCRNRAWDCRITGAGRVMAGLLYETSASDPWLLSAVTAVFVLVALARAWCRRGGRAA